MSWSRALIAFFVDAFRPPFRTAPWIVVLYVLLSIIYNSGSSFNHWVMPDTDDYMRMSQVFYWLSGHSWFDFSVPHLYPQHPIAMHWARLPDLLLAGVYITLHSLARFFQWNSDKQSIGLLTAFFTPIFLLTALMFLVREMARPLMSKRLAGVVCFFALTCGQLMFQYLPMRVDHHAYILLGAGVAFFCLQGLVLHVRPHRMAIGAGLALALAMWNGAEILPMVVFFCLALTALIIFDRRLFFPAALFGVSFLTASFVVLLLAKAPGQRWEIQYDAFSYFYVLLAALVAAFFLLQYGVALLTHRRAIHISFAVFSGLCGLWLLLHEFPDFIFGPYARTNPELETSFFPNIREAIPLYKAWADLGDAFSSTPNQSVGGGLYYLSTRMFVCMMGIFTSFYMAFRSPRGSRRQKLWAIYAFFSTAYGILAMMWEVRVITYAQLFSVAPLAWVTLTYLKTLPRHYAGRKLFAYEMLTVFALAIFPTVFLPAIITQSRFMPDMLFFLGKGVETPCGNRLQIISYLRDLAERQKKVSTIMAPMDYTPELMYYTPHNFIAAPYHRNDRGILDMVLFFRSKPDDVSARAIAKRLNLDYVLVCKASYFQGTLNKGPEVKNVQITYNQNKLQMTPEAADVLKASLGMRLAYEKTPAWLEQRDIPLETDFALFEVKKNRLGKIPLPPGGVRGGNSLPARDSLSKKM